MSAFSTARLCDQHDEGGHLQVAESIFRAFGGAPTFHGSVTTLKVFEDNALLREVLGTPSPGGVLVVDGGGSQRCALFGATLAHLAVEHGWVGIVVYGSIRNAAEIARLPIGIRALGTHPLRARKHGHGERDILVTFAGVNFRTGCHLWADEDGLVIAPNTWDT